MISVNGDKLVLEGSKEVLQTEAAYMIGILRSRLLSKGYGPETVKHEIAGIVTASERFPPDRLRSDAKMTAERELLKRRQ